MNRNEEEEEEKEKEVNHNDNDEDEDEKESRPLQMTTTSTTISAATSSSSSWSCASTAAAGGGGANNIRDDDDDGDELFVDCESRTPIVSNITTTSTTTRRVRVVGERKDDEEFLKTARTGGVVTAAVDDHDDDEEEKNMNNRKKNNKKTRSKSKSNDDDDEEIVGVAPDKKEPQQQERTIFGPMRRRAPEEEMTLTVPSIVNSSTTRRRTETTTIRGSSSAVVVDDDEQQKQQQEDLLLLDDVMMMMMTTTMHQRQRKQQRQHQQERIGGEMMMTQDDDYDDEQVIVFDHDEDEDDESLIVSPFFAERYYNNNIKKNKRNKNKDTSSSSSKRGSGGIQNHAGLCPSSSFRSSNSSRAGTTTTIAATASSTTEQQDEEGGHQHRAMTTTRRHDTSSRYASMNQHEIIMLSDAALADTNDDDDHHHHHHNEQLERYYNNNHNNNDDDDDIDDANIIKRVQNVSRRAALTTKQAVWDSNEAPIHAALSAVDQWESTYTALRTLLVATVHSMRNVYGTAKDGVSRLEHGLLIPVRDWILLPAFVGAERTVMEVSGFIGSDHAKQLAYNGLNIIERIPFIGDTILAPTVSTMAKTIQRSWEIIQSPIPSRQQVRYTVDHVLNGTKRLLSIAVREVYMYLQRADANITRTLSHTQWKVLGSGPYATLDKKNKQFVLDHLCERYLSLTSTTNTTTTSATNDNDNDNQHQQSTSSSSQQQHRHDIAASIISRYELACHIRMHNRPLYHDLVQTGLLLQRGGDIISNDVWLYQQQQQHNNNNMRPSPRGCTNGGINNGDNVKNGSFGVVAGYSSCFEQYRGLQSRCAQKKKINNNKEEEDDDNNDDDDDDDDEPTEDKPYLIRPCSSRSGQRNDEFSLSLPHVVGKDNTLNDNDNNNYYYYYEEEDRSEDDDVDGHNNKHRQYCYEVAPLWFRLPYVNGEPPSKDAPWICFQEHEQQALEERYLRIIHGEEDVEHDDAENRINEQQEQQHRRTNEIPSVVDGSTTTTTASSTKTGMPRYPRPRESTTSFSSSGYPTMANWYTPDLSNDVLVDQQRYAVTILPACSECGKAHSTSNNYNNNNYNAAHRHPPLLPVPSPPPPNAKRCGELCDECIIVRGQSSVGGGGGGNNHRTNTPGRNTTTTTTTSTTTITTTKLITSSSSSSPCPPPSVSSVVRPTFWRFHGPGDKVRRGTWFVDTARHGLQPFDEEAQAILEDAYQFLLWIDRNNNNNKNKYSYTSGREKTKRKSVATTSTKKTTNEAQQQRDVGMDEKKQSSPLSSFSDSTQSTSSSEVATSTTTTTTGHNDNINASEYNHYKGGDSNDVKEEGGGKDEAVSETRKDGNNVDKQQADYLGEEVEEKEEEDDDDYDQEPGGEEPLDEALLTVEVPCPDGTERLVQFSSLHRATAIKKGVGAAIALFKRRVYRGAWLRRKKITTKTTTQIDGDDIELGATSSTTATSPSVASSPRSGVSHSSRDDERQGINRRRGRSKSTITNSLAVPRERLCKEDMAKYLRNETNRKIDHLVLIVHGIGEMMRSIDVFGLGIPNLSSIVDCCGYLRRNHVQVQHDESNSRNNSNMDDGEAGRVGSRRITSGRVEYLPVEWHEAFSILSQRRAPAAATNCSTFDAGQGDRSRRRSSTTTTSPCRGDGKANVMLISDISLRTIPNMRDFANDTLMDVLYFMSPEHHDIIIDLVTSEMNTVVRRFRHVTGFDGRTSLAGHSLGSVISWDILSNQSTITSTGNRRIVVGPSRSNIPSSAVGIASTTTHAHIDLGGDEVDTPEVTSFGVHGDQTQTALRMYPQLDFFVDNFFLLGSPVAVFLMIRNQRKPLREDFYLSGCRRVFNIFHPYDPVAYRIEPCIDVRNADFEPTIMKHWKGGFRVQYQTKRLWKKLVETTLKTQQSVIEAFEAKMAGMGLIDSSNVLHSRPPTTADDDVDESSPSASLGGGGGGDFGGRTGSAGYRYDKRRPISHVMAGMLNQGRRIDFMLQEKEIENANEYVAALAAHSSYWIEKDVSLFFARQIYLSTLEYGERG